MVALGEVDGQNETGSIQITKKRVSNIYLTMNPELGDLRKIIEFFGHVSACIQSDYN